LDPPLQLASPSPGHRGPRTYQPPDSVQKQPLDASQLGRLPPELGEVREALECIAADAQRSSEVIRSFRAMFGKRYQPETRIDANELVRETVALMQGELEATRVAV